jgi:hypothetical protein
MVVLALAVLCVGVGVAAAQTQFEPADTFQVTYYSHININDTTERDGNAYIVNPGTAVTKIDANGKPLNGNLCAMIYVFNDDEQQLECCGCKVSPNGERTFNIEDDLLGNVINATNFTFDGVIKVVSALPNSTGRRGVCRPDLSNIVPTPALRSWSTHSIATSYPDETSDFTISEEELSSAPLSNYELLSLESQCSAIFTSGSGPGICKCGFGG